MPQSTTDLQKKFMVNGSDGIGEAEDIIKTHGGKIVKFMISLPEGKEFKDMPQEYKDAENFLVGEWDYGCI